MAKRKHWVAAAVAVGFGLVAAGPAFAAEVVNVVNGVALRGYDPVAFFTQNKAVEGNAAISAAYQGATYDFASNEDRALFVADPAKYAPQYGGFCAIATSHGKKADADPKAYTIVDGKLYVNNSDIALAVFNNGVKDNIKAADQKWPDVEKIDHVIR